MIDVEGSDSCLDDYVRETSDFFRQLQDAWDDLSKRPREELSTYTIYIPNYIINVQVSQAINEDETTVKNAQMPSLESVSANASI